MADYTKCKEHKWKTGNQIRECKKCGLKQIQQWLDIPKNVEIKYE